MKKMVIAVMVLGLVSSFLWLENSHVKNESQALQQELEQVQDEESKYEYHGQAGETAERFLESYFNYEGQPGREDVEPYAVTQVLDDLQFQEPEMEYEDMGPVRSTVDNVNVYFGESTEDMQEVVILFDNIIEVEGTESSTFSILEMDVSLEDGAWKVQKLFFQQLG
ncbi:hypothetical protein [Natribacillus halophilus]|uniref:Uncharacterized protein n=1 Tax=Natribacillus halophilus TaxID=549003 RepID=A0A1G8Q8D5_9BACI|nr:hypothetical protein [Natribacillus halophilus]SDJ00987.1 hypothetical protein SAMN04488123_1117 [Natribacillus halophilus]